MRSRTAAFLAALLLIGLLPGAVMAAKRPATVTWEVVQYEGSSSASCADFFEVALVHWKGATVNASRVTWGTFTTAGTLDQELGTLTRSRKNAHKGSVSAVAEGTVPSGARVGADVRLLFHGKTVGRTFVDFGTCAP